MALARAVLAAVSSVVRQSEHKISFSQRAFASTTIVNGVPVEVRRSNLASPLDDYVNSLARTRAAVLTRRLDR